MKGRIKSFLTRSKSRLLLLIFFVIILDGCYAPGSFKVGKTGVGSNGTIVLMQFTTNHPYVILHEGDSAWQLSDYKLNDDYSKITGILKELPPERMSYKKVNPNETNIAADTNAYPFDEMHVMTKNILADSSGQVTINHLNIEEIQLYNKINYKKKNTTTAATAASVSVVVTVLLILAGIAVVAAIVAFITILIKSIFSDK